MKISLVVLLLVICFGPLMPASLLADGPSDNKATSVRPIPPPGVAISDEQRAKIVAELQSLDTKLKQLQSVVASKGQSHEKINRYLPDVEIFARALELALNEDGFFEPKDADRALDVLKEGHRRADALATNSAYWNLLPMDGQPLVRGYRSRLDGSAQPYGVVTSLRELVGSGADMRTDVWCRGRSEKGLELQFLAARMTNSDPKPAPGIVMIHPFGRYCNANKLAGEIDTLEALEHATQEYRLDPNRVAIRGFSMGGAAAWHLAVHYPSKWFAATPGAGFSETPQFLKVFQSEDLQPTWYEKKLWQMYDCPVWVRNLRMLPTIAYSGEIDKQKQAADVMAEASWELPEDERFELTHIIAPKTAHSISPAAARQIESKLQALDAVRSATPPKEIHFTTTSLKYNKAHWITIDALSEHWIPATVNAQVSDELSIILRTENVTALTLDLPIEFNAGSDTLEVQLLNSSTKNFDHVKISRTSDRSWHASFRRDDINWVQVSPLEGRSGKLAKKHDLQGPIDDAFMDSFLFVKPSSGGINAEVDKWVNSEFNRAVKEWHRQMRGDVRVKTSEELQPSDIDNHHLILWGDAKSNPTLAKIADKLPIQWNDKSVVVGAKTYPGTTHVPVMIYPNPMNPDRYVVLNSSFTYREYDYLNNARQVPKLPDWAIVDMTTPPDSRWPGKIEDAGFFDETWKLK